MCNERSWRLVQNLFSEAHKVVKSIASFHQLVNGSYKTLIALLDSAHKIYSSNSDESISHILAHNLPEATRLLLTSVNEVLVFNNIGSLIALIDFSKNSFLNPIRAKLTPDEHSIYPQSSLLPKNLQSTASLDKINGFDHTPLQVGPAYMNFFCKLNIIYETPKNQTLKPQMIVSLEKRLQPIVFLCPTGSSPSLMAVTFDTCAYIINPDERSSLKIKPPWDLEALEFEEAEGESPEADDANENNFFCAGGITSASGLSAACLIVQKRVPPQSPKAVLYLLSTYDFESAIYEKNTKSSVGPGLQSLFEYQWLSNHAETVIMMAKPNTTNPHNISSIRKCVICDESMTSVDSEKKYIKCTSCSIGVCLPL